MWRWQAGGMLQVHEFPPFNTSRTGEGSWVMTNHIGTFTCKVRASFLCLVRLSSPVCLRQPIGQPWLISQSCLVRMISTASLRVAWVISRPQA